MSSRLRLSEMPADSKAAVVPSRSPGSPTTISSIVTNRPIVLPGLGCGRAGRRVDSGSLAATSSIRVASDEELPAVGAVGSRAGFGPRVLDQLRFLRARELGEVFVAGIDGEPVGASACIAFAGTGWIGAVGVVPEARNQGIGAALTEVAVDWLRQAGADPVLLQATTPGRPGYGRL